MEVYADSGLVRFEYKHFAFLGPESNRAAEAAECANEQGQFWPYHEVIFANQRGENGGAFIASTLNLFAEAIELDEDAFAECLNDRTYRAVVTSETAEGRQLGVGSTPTIVINGQLLDGGAPAFATLQSLIQAELGN